MTSLFDRQSTDYVFQERMEQGSWREDKSGCSSVTSKVQSILRSMNTLAESEGIDLIALAADANNALGGDTSQPTAEEIRQIAEVEISDFRHPLP